METKDFVLGFAAGKAQGGGGGGLPSGGTAGQVLTKTANDAAWADAPKELPTSGNMGMVLTL